MASKEHRQSGLADPILSSLLKIKNLDHQMIFGVISHDGVIQE